MENNKYDMETAQKYAYYYQKSDSYYNKLKYDNYTSSFNPKNSVGILIVPFVIALFTIAKYIFTIIFVPAIPFMFLGYKIALLLSISNILIKLLFILLFGVVGVSIQLIVIKYLNNNIFKKRYFKWILFIFFYLVNIYIIFILANYYPVKDLIFVKKVLLELFSFI